MAVIRVLGRDLVDEFDVPDYLRSGSLEAFETSSSVEHTAIGKGKPLVVEIVHVYSGRFPQKSFFGSSDGDVAVVSGVKNFGTFNASPRALNFIARDHAPRTIVNGPSGFQEGTNVVMYSPALLSRSVTLSIELAVAQFPSALLDRVSAAASTLAGVPILLPYSGYLLAAGQVLNIGNDLGRGLFNGPVWQITEELRIDVPGFPRLGADFRILASQDFPASDYVFDPTSPAHPVKDRNGKPYDGDEPYVVLNIDGRAEPALESFAPTVASAAVLERFFGARDNASLALDAMVSGITLASDLEYSRKIDALTKKLENVGDANQRAAIEAEIAALRQNILTDELKR